jgi:hypothetical protein
MTKNKSKSSTAAAQSNERDDAATPAVTVPVATQSSQGKPAQESNAQPTLVICRNK